MSKLLIIDCDTKHLEEVKKMAFPYFSEIEIIKNDDFDRHTNADFVIITGGSNTRSVMRHAEDYKNIIDFLISSNIPILGICLGCEIIASSFGSTISELQTKEIEIKNICFKNEDYCIEAVEAHKFYIEKIGDNLEILATGNNNSIEIIKHKTKKIIGVQFHPEISNNSKNIFKHLINLVK